MNQTDNKGCYFFEDDLTKFDVSDEVFITNIVTCILNCVFSLLTCMANFLIVFSVIGKTHELHSPSFVLLGCLASSDLVVGLICQPILVTHKIAELNKNFPAYCTSAMLNFISGWVTAVVSSLTLGAVSIDRVLCLILHLRYNTLVTVSRVFKTVAIMWIFSIAFSMVRFWMSNDSWYFIAMTVLLMPFLVISVSTLKIFQIVRSHQRQINVQTEAIRHLQSNTVNVLKCRKSAVTVLYIYGLLLIFFLPFFVVMIIEVYHVGYTRKIRIAYSYVATAVFINSFLNPLVYCWRNRELRRAAKRALTRD